MSQRHRARRLALQGLCCLDVQGPKALELTRHFINDSKEPPDTLTAAWTMLSETLEDRDRCDELLTRHAKRWELSRLALVDRNILRLAVHELIAGATPPGVVITESLRLAQEFSSGESLRFINGILDAAAKELQEKQQQ